MEFITPEQLATPIGMVAVVVALTKAIKSLPFFRDSPDGAVETISYAISLVVYSVATWEPTIEYRRWLILVPTNAWFLSFTANKSVEVVKRTAKKFASKNGSVKTPMEVQKTEVQENGGDV